MEKYLYGDGGCGYSGTGFGDGWIHGNTDGDGMGVGILNELGDDEDSIGNTYGHANGRGDGFIETIPFTIFLIHFEKV